MLLGPEQPGEGLALDSAGIGGQGGGLEGVKLVGFRVALGDEGIDVERIQLRSQTDADGAAFSGAESKLIPAAALSAQVAAGGGGVTVDD